MSVEMTRQQADLLEGFSPFKQLGINLTLDQAIEIAQHCQRAGIKASELTRQTYEQLKAGRLDSGRTSAEIAYTLSAEESEQMSAQDLEKWAIQRRQELKNV